MGSARAPNLLLSPPGGDGIQEGGHEKKTNRSKRCCSKVFCKFTTGTIGFRVEFQLGIFKTAFFP